MEALELDPKFLGTFAILGSDDGLAELSSIRGLIGDSRAISPCEAVELCAWFAEVMQQIPDLDLWP